MDRLDAFFEWTFDFVDSHIDKALDVIYAGTVRLLFLAVTAVFGGFIGYLSGLSTQPILGLTVTVFIACGSLLLGLFKLSLSDSERAGHLSSMLTLCPQTYPFAFSLCVFAFCGTCYLGLHRGIDDRKKETAEVYSEMDQLPLSGDEKLLCMLLLKRLHELGFSEAERQQVIADFDQVNTADAFAYTHAEVHKEENPFEKLGIAYNDSLAYSGSDDKRLVALQSAVYEFLGKAHHGRYHRLESMLRFLTSDDKENDIVANLGDIRQIPMTDYHPTAQTLRRPPRFPGDENSDEPKTQMPEYVQPPTLNPQD